MELREGDHRSVTYNETVVLKCMDPPSNGVWSEARSFSQRVSWKLRVSGQQFQKLDVARIQLMQSWFQNWGLGFHKSSLAWFRILPSSPIEIPGPSLAIEDSQISFEEVSLCVLVDEYVIVRDSTLGC